MTDEELIREALLEYQHLNSALCGPDADEALAALDRIKLERMGETEKCPHIISSDEGTSYCDLAGRTAEYIKNLEAEINRCLQMPLAIEDDLISLHALWLDAVDSWLECFNVMLCKAKENEQLRAQLAETIKKLEEAEDSKRYAWDNTKIIEKDRQAARDQLSKAQADIERLKENS